MTDPLPVVGFMSLHARHSPLHRSPSIRSCASASALASLAVSINFCTRSGYIEINSNVAMSSINDVTDPVALSLACQMAYSEGRFISFILLVLYTLCCQSIYIYKHRRLKLGRPRLPRTCKIIQTGTRFRHRRVMPSCRPQRLNSVTTRCIITILLTTAYTRCVSSFTHAAARAPHDPSRSFTRLSTAS